LEEIVAITGIHCDLFEATSSGTLERDDVGVAREEFFILEIGERELAGLFDESVKLELEGCWVDLWYAAVVADEEVFVGRELGVGQA
jgi:hypothetical protein